MLVRAHKSMLFRAHKETSLGQTADRRRTEVFFFSFLYCRA